jgi:WD40 repeat protein
MGACWRRGVGITPSSCGVWRMALVRTLTGHTDGVLSVSFSPDGSLLASGSGDKTIKLWRVADGVGAHPHGAHRWGHQRVVFAGWAFAGVGEWDKTIKLWRVSDGSLVRTLTGHTYGVLSVSFSPDGSLLASGSGIRPSSCGVWRMVRWCAPSRGTQIGSERVVFAGWAFAGVGE